MGSLDELHPDFKPLALRLLDHVTELCGRVGIEHYIACAWRDPRIQMQKYKRGRAYTNGRWVVVDEAAIVTHAPAFTSPHNFVINGEPASFALDIALTEGGQWLGDKDQRWSIIPTAASLVGDGELVSGAFFSRIRDFPHVELAGWRSYA